MREERRGVSLRRSVSCASCARGLTLPDDSKERHGLGASGAQKSVRTIDARPLETPTMLRSHAILHSASPQRVRKKTRAICSCSRFGSRRPGNRPALRPVTLALCKGWWLELGVTFDLPSEAFFQTAWPAVAWRSTPTTTSRAPPLAC